MKKDMNGVWIGVESIAFVGFRVGCEMDTLAEIQKNEPFQQVLTTPIVPKIRVFGRFDKKIFLSIVNAVSDDVKHLATKH